MVIRDINELLPTAKEACRLFLAECEKEGLDVLITETYRSQQRQDELYAKGRTEPGEKVTWTKNSRHTSRLAWDICQNKKGGEYSDTEFFKACGGVAKRLGITWGGDWKTPDMPHFEVTKKWIYKGGVEMEKRISELEKKLAELENEVIASSAILEALLEKQPKRYHYTVEVPEWGRVTVQKLLDEGIFSGTAADDLNLSEDMLRMMVITERMGNKK